MFSDVICPWCFIGKRRLDAVIEQGRVGEIELEWRPYQLYPNLPSGGMARVDFLRARYGESADASRTPERIRLEAEEVGITFDYAAVDRVPNTLSAHRLLAMRANWAANTSSQKRYSKRVFATDPMSGMSTRSSIVPSLSVWMVAL